MIERLDDLDSDEKINLVGPSTLQLCLSMQYGPQMEKLRQVQVIIMTSDMARLRLSDIYAQESAGN